MGLFVYICGFFVYKKLMKSKFCWWVYSFTSLTLGPALTLIGNPLWAGDGKLFKT